MSVSTRKKVGIFSLLYLLICVVFFCALTASDGLAQVEDLGIVPNDTLSGSVTVTASLHNDQYDENGYRYVIQFNETATYTINSIPCRRFLLAGIRQYSGKPTNVGCTINDQIMGYDSDGKLSGKDVWQGETEVSCGAAPETPTAVQPACIPGAFYLVMRPAESKYKFVFNDIYVDSKITNYYYVDGIEHVGKQEDYQHTMHGHEIEGDLPAESTTLSGSMTFPSSDSGMPFLDPEVNVPVTVSWDFQVGPPPTLKAKPNISAAVTRGEPLQLDGSASTGDIVYYEWSFKPMVPSSPQPNTQAKIQGETASVVLLKSMYVTLTVSDGKKKDKKTVTVQVQPRSWELPFEQLPEEGILPYSMGGKPYHHAGGDIQYSGGENVCAIDPPQSDADPPHIIHPKKNNSNSWNDNGYEIEQVNDEGPFSGWCYVENQTIQVQRQILINQYIRPDGPVIFPGMPENFYTANVNRGKDAPEYLAAVRQHESDHTTKMRNALTFYDPAKKLETTMDQDRDEIIKKADAIIQKAEDLMSRATSDCRMPVIWRGELLVPDDSTYVWTPITLQVGGAPPNGCK